MSSALTARIIGYSLTKEPSMIDCRQISIGPFTASTTNCMSLSIEALGLRGLQEATTRKRYIDNLIEIYSALAKAFRNDSIVSHVHAYPCWRDCGD